MSSVLARLALPSRSPAPPNTLSASSRFDFEGGFFGRVSSWASRVRGLLPLAECVPADDDPSAPIDGGGRGEGVAAVAGPDVPLRSHVLQPE